MVFAAAVLVTARPDLFSGPGGASQCRAATAIQKATAPLAEGPMAAFQTTTPVSLVDLPYGDGRTLSDFAGRTILLNLWATWCAPCRAEMADLAQLQQRLGSDAFEVVAVSIDSNDANRPEDFLAETNAEALAYHREPTLALFNSLRTAGLALGMPTTLLVGSDGCVAGTLAGAAPWGGPQAERLVRAALAADTGSGQ
nr:TlpA disulfide reductase family protein [Acuticoccus mangrovi]